MPPLLRVGRCFWRGLSHLIINFLSVCCGRIPTTLFGCRRKIQNLRFRVRPAYPFCPLLLQQLPLPVVAVSWLDAADTRRSCIPSGSTILAGQPCGEVFCFLCVSVDYRKLPKLSTFGFRNVRYLPNMALLTSGSSYILYRFRTSPACPARPPE